MSNFLCDLNQENNHYGITLTAIGDGCDESVRGRDARTNGNGSWSSDASCDACSLPASSSDVCSKAKDSCISAAIIDNASRHTCGDNLFVKVWPN
jgi:hypothetical protein